MIATASPPLGRAGGMGMAFPPALRRLAAAGWRHGRRPLSLLALPGLLAGAAALQIWQLDRAAETWTRVEAAGEPSPADLATAILTVDSARRLPQLVDFADFELDKVLAGSAAVPRLYFASLPGDLDRLAGFDQLKVTFLKAALPLVLLVNEQVMADRRRLLALRDEVAAGFNLHAADQAWVFALARRYKVQASDLDELVRRVDLVPPSMALGQAATETGWGTSRPARRDNALFGQMIPAGPMPADGTPPALVVQPFEDLFNCVQSYVENLNTNPAYAAFRQLRAEMRAHGEGPDGYRLAGTLLRYSERGPGYIADVQKLIRDNDLGRLDGAVLDRASRARLVIPST
jgi:Bax protein